MAQDARDYRGGQEQDALDRPATGPTGDPTGPNVPLPPRTPTWRRRWNDALAAMLTGQPPGPLSPHDAIDARAAGGDPMPQSAYPQGFGPGQGPVADFVPNGRYGGALPVVAPTGPAHTAPVNVPGRVVPLPNLEPILPGRPVLPGFSDEHVVPVAPEPPISPHPPLDQWELDAGKKAKLERKEAAHQKRTLAKAHRQVDMNSLMRPYYEVIEIGDLTHPYNLQLKDRPRSRILVSTATTINVLAPGASAIFTIGLSAGWNILDMPENTQIFVALGTGTITALLCCSYEPLDGTSGNRGLVTLQAGAAVIGVVELADSAGVNKLAVDASGKIGVNNFVANVDAGVMINAVGATTNQNTADQSNFNSRGIKVFTNMTNAGTGSITVAIQGKDTGSGTYYTILAGAAITANGTQLLTVYPGITATANVAASDFLPKTWRILVTANNANATTYTVSAEVEI